jgi:pyruvate/2-oxoglutarate dehydrogenase complex dihydrolipoamide acyltransferase (E2) component
MATNGKAVPSEEVAGLTKGLKAALKKGRDEIMEQLQVKQLFLVMLAFDGDPTPNIIAVLADEDDALLTSLDRRLQYLASQRLQPGEAVRCYITTMGMLPGSETGDEPGFLVANEVKRSWTFTAPKPEKPKATKTTAKKPSTAKPAAKKQTAAKASAKPAAKSPAKGAAKRATARNTTAKKVGGGTGPRKASSAKKTAARRRK